MQYSSEEYFNISEVQTDAYWKVEFGEGPLSGFPDIRVQTSELPKPELRNITIDFHGYEIESYGTVKYGGPLTITFIEPVDMKLTQKIEEEFLATGVYTRTPDGVVNGKQGKAHSELFQSFTMISYNRKGEETGRYEVKHATINAFDPGYQFNTGSSPDYAKPTVTFTVNFYGYKAAGLSPS